MLEWLKKLFTRPEPGFVQVDTRTGEETLVKDTPEGKLWETITTNTCPDCGAKEGFYEGPSGGMSTNISCVACEARFNVTPVIGRAERI